eukprot:scaffold10974_cov154-Skeletonema_marinoi.AAC.7
MRKRGMPTKWSSYVESGLLKDSSQQLRATKTYVASGLKPSFIKSSIFTSEHGPWSIYCSITRL